MNSGGGGVEYYNRGLTIQGILTIFTDINGRNIDLLGWDSNKHFLHQNSLGQREGDRQDSH